MHYRFPDNRTWFHAVLILKADTYIVQIVPASIFALVVDNNIAVKLSLMLILYQ